MVWTPTCWLILIDRGSGLSTLCCCDLPNASSMISNQSWILMLDRLVVLVVKFVVSSKWWIYYQLRIQNIFSTDTKNMIKFSLLVISSICTDISFTFMIYVDVQKLMINFDKTHILASNNMNSQFRNMKISTSTQHSTWTGWFFLESIGCLFCIMPF